MIPQTFQLAEAEPLRLWPGWVATQGRDPVRLYAWLFDHLPWRRGRIRTAGGLVRLPRDEVFLATEPGKVYEYSGNRYEAGDLNNYQLGRLLEAVQETTGRRFNACFLNRYVSGSDSIGWHADDKPMLGEPDRIVIASVSVGQRRGFELKSIRKGEGSRRAAEHLKLELGEGDLLLMGEGTQSRYVHQVPKVDEPVGGRIVLTFRWLP